MVGRPSKAVERRDQILDAMEICVREHGVALASLRRIAEQSDLSLQMVSHYFGNRQSLILAFVERVANRLTSTIAAAALGEAASERLFSTIRFLCDGRYKDLPGNDAMGREIWGLAERDNDVRLIVWDAYERSLDHLEKLLAEAYPHAPRKKHRATAYGIMCLTEANEFFSGISAGALPSGLAEEIVHSLLQGLDVKDDKILAELA